MNETLCEFCVCISDREEDIAGRGKKGKNENGKLHR